MSTAEAVVLPELVRSGALTPGQGAAAVEMIREEDPVVFAACRVAGAAAATAAAAAAATPAAAAAATAAAAAAAVGGSSGGGGRSVAGGGGGSGTRGWSDEAKSSFASMLKLVLYGRERGGGVGQANGGLGLGVMVAGCRGRQRGESAAGGGGEEEAVWGRAERLLGGDELCGRREPGGGGEEETCRDSVRVPETFQSDTIALADVALVTGKVKSVSTVEPLVRVLWFLRRAWFMPSTRVLSAPGAPSLQICSLRWWIVYLSRGDVTNNVYDCLGLRVWQLCR